VRTILYFRDVEFETLGGPIPTHARLRYAANSRFTASRVAATFGIEAPAIPPLVRPEAYRTPGDGEHVLFVNPEPRKGLDIALALARANPDIPFVFLESWPRSPHHVAALTATLRMHPNVVFRRATLNMAEQYARARLLIVPSVWEEPWGRVVTEAHASGIPAIAAAIGGLPESVGPGGILVRPGSPIEVWSQHLRSLWTSRSLYARYRQHALDHAARDDIQPHRLLRCLLDVASAPW
jgi:glycosyltransferase involved in cell wall biosynthesis